MADVKRTNYFDRQFLRARDFQDEQAYHLDQQRRHNRLLHTPGVAEGLVVSGSTGSTVVTVSPGVAVDAQGREIVLSDPSNLTMPTGQASVDVFISYREEPSDPSAEPGITGFTRITESPNLSVTPAGTAPAGALLLARVPLNSANGQINGAINNNVRTMASSSIIGDGAITEPKLANNAVSTRTIQDNAVNAAKILDGSVGNAELANNAVTAPKIADNAVAATKLSDNAVTAAKLQSHASDDAQRAVGNLHIKNNSVSIAKLSAILVVDSEVSVPAAPAVGKVGEAIVTIEKVDEHAFYLISTRYVGPRPIPAGGPSITISFTWAHQTSLVKPGGTPPQQNVHQHELVIQNPNTASITVSCKVYRLTET